MRKIKSVSSLNDEAKSGNLSAKCCGYLFMYSYGLNGALRWYFNLKEQLCEMKCFAGSATNVDWVLQKAYFAFDCILLLGGRNQNVYLKHGEQELLIYTVFIPGDRNVVPARGERGLVLAVISAYQRIQHCYSLNLFQLCLCRIASLVGKCIEH